MTDYFKIDKFAQQAIAAEYRQEHGMARFLADVWGELTADEGRRLLTEISIREQEQPQS